jgi:penicillin-binding protein-related factor A (putative recombinase)
VKQGESQLSNKLKLDLATQYPSSRWWKNHGTEYSEAGISDITGCVHGRLCAIEVKFNNGWFSPLQVAYLKDIERAGGIALGFLKKNDEYYLIPTGAMGHKGNRHRELWVKLNYPGDLYMIFAWDVGDDLL